MTETATPPKESKFDRDVLNDMRSTPAQVIHALRNRTPAGVKAYYVYADARSRAKTLPKEQRDRWRAIAEAIENLKERDHDTAGGVRHNNER